MGIVCCQYYQLIENVIGVQWSAKEITTGMIMSTKKKRIQIQRKESFAQRLCKRATSNGVEQEVFARTKGYKDFRCIGNLRKAGAISNFLKSVKREKLKKEKRETAAKLYREHAQHLRQGLAAGTLRNFVRHRGDDEEDDVASWRRQKGSVPPSRTDHSAYDLFRVQKQMIGLAIYYESMLKTGTEKTDQFATQEDALVFNRKKAKLV